MESELNVPLFQLMKIAPIGICITDNQGFFTSVNDAYCQIYDYEASFLIGKHFTVVTFEKDRSYWYNYYSDFWQKNLLWGEAEVRHRSGKMLNIIARAFKLEYYKITFVLDITPIRQAEELIKDQHKTTLTKVVRAQEDERKRISAELHDGLGQLHTLAKLSVNNIEEILESVHKPNHPMDIVLTHRMFHSLKSHVDVLRHNFEDIHLELDRIINNLRPLPLTSNGIIPALELLCKRVSKVSPAKIQLFCDAEEEFRLESETELHLYRIAQELLTNAVKHSGAKNIYLQLVYDAPNLTLSVEDDGKGFDINEVEVKKRLGLHSVRTRAQLINADLQIDTAPNKGSSYIIGFVTK